MDPSPRDHDQSTCVMLTLSDGDRSVNHSPRGVLRSARFSSRFDRGIKLHRTDVILPRWEALRGRSGFLAIRGDVRRPSDRWISIGRPEVDSPHDRGARDQRNRDRPSSWIFIGRRRSIVEELHDRGPIEPRSRRDRAAIGEFKEGNRLQAIGERSTAYQDFDRGPIVARSWDFLRRKSRTY